ncbi:hypothetical protein FJT64_015220 [Amphibalanus amphitrite]|uniref:Uncharacterized protein n=1 Tax=Amphibalanus amphitrite TaxID=1232801 RepID=A0A6A4XDB0_AMPAM|nr:hypothetical protein FJT64_015220 [Amphibalanus amphitrite]
MADAVEQLGVLLSQQLQAMAEERQEAKEREARLTERLLQLVPAHTPQPESRPTGRLSSAATPAPRLFSGASLPDATDDAGLHASTVGDRLPLIAQQNSIIDHRRSYVQQLNVTMSTNS